MFMHKRSLFYYQEVAMKEVYQKTKEELFNEYGNSQGLNDEKASEYAEHAHAAQKPEKIEF